MSNTKIIYHGASEKIEKPFLDNDCLRNDFGRGFYCSTKEDREKEWVCADGNNGVVNSYELNLSKLNVKELTEKSCILNWIAVLLKNRTFVINSAIAKLAKDYLLNNYYVDTSEYDVVAGYCADGSFFALVNEFLNNTVSLKALETAFDLYNADKQIVLKTQLALSNLKYNALTIAKSDFNANRYCEKDKAFRKKVFQAELILDDSDLFISDIIKLGAKKNDSVI